MPEWDYPGLFDSLALILLSLYPLRHIHTGGDLWDTGYNYANFRYMGLEHMDSMWLFSTYLGNALGHFFSMLPGGHTVLGLNFYTGLLVSLLALVGYGFCTRKLKIRPGLALLGEFVAVNLCWCPTALLYNYLTYVFLLLALIFLYQGLTLDRFGRLLISGVFFGLNVFVRFPNIVELAFLAVIWVYGLFERKDIMKGEGKRVIGRETKEFLRNAFLRTLHVVGGYLTAAFVCLLFLGFRYGFSSYFEGVLRLFDMTDSASDYKATSMLAAIVLGFWKQKYWMIRILFFVAVGCLVCTGFRYLDKRFGTILRADPEHVPVIKGISFLTVGYILSGLCSVAMVVWLLTRKTAEGAGAFTSTLYDSYDPIYVPGVLFLACILLTAAIRTLAPSADLKERLISMLVAGMLLISCIGSNNGLYPAFNNLFLGAPYLFWEMEHFLTEEEWQRRKISLFGLKAALIGLLGICVVQFTAFGCVFVFAEGTGVKQPMTTVSGNPVFSGVRVNSDRAESLYEITYYVNRRGISGQPVILYGNVPALSFYLQMPSAFNPWSDLDSYSKGQFEEKLMNQMDAPVIILGAEYLESEKAEKDGKLKLLMDYIEEYGYHESFRNEDFIIYE